MPPLVKRDASFVIRIWWERRSQKPALWRGQIIHVQTGQTRFFQRENALASFIRRWTGMTGEGTDNSLFSPSSHKEEFP